MSLQDYAKKITQWKNSVTYYPDEDWQRELFESVLATKAYLWNESFLIKNPSARLTVRPFLSTDAIKVSFSAFRELYALLYCASLEEERNLKLEERKNLINVRSLTLILAFGNFKSAFHYLERFEKNNSSSNQPVHDACQFSMPENHCNLALWQGFIRKNPPHSTKHFILSILPLAKKIELRHEQSIKISSVNESLELRNKLKQQIVPGALFANEEALNSYLDNKVNQFIAEKIRDTLFPSTNLAQLKDYLSQCSYIRSEENIEAAKMFFHYNMGEKDFDDWLDLLPLAQDDDVAIPIITIEGEDIHESYADFILEKLPSDSPKAALLGKMTDCCQTINAEGHVAVHFAISEKEAGFYVIRRKSNNQIIAQGIAFRNVDGSLVIDSAELKKIFRGENSTLVTDLFTALGHELITHYNIPEVTVGTGGRTPENLGTLERDYPHVHPKLKYWDSLEQRLIAHQTIPAIHFYIEKMRGKTKLDTNHFGVREVTNWEGLFHFIESITNLESKINALLYLLSLSKEKDEDLYQVILAKYPLLEVNSERLNALHNAILQDDFNQVEFLVENFPPLINKIDGDGKTTLLLATESYCCFEILQYLCNKVPQLLTKGDYCDRMPIHMAILVGSFEKFYFLLEQKPELAYLTNRKGETLVHYAAKDVDYRKHEILEYLGENFPEIMLKQNRDGQTGLHLAITEWDTISYFINKFPEAKDIKDNVGRTFLHIAAERTQWDNVRRIIEDDPELLSSKVQGYPLAYIAVEQNKKDVVATIIKANPEMALSLETTEETILDRAFQRQNLDMVKCIIENYFASSTEEKRHKILVCVEQKNNPELKEWMIKNYQSDFNDSKVKEDILINEKVATHLQIIMDRYNLFTTDSPLYFLLKQNVQLYQFGSGVAEKSLESFQNQLKDLRSKQGANVANAAFFKPNINPLDLVITIIGAIRAQSIKAREEDAPRIF